MGPLLHLLYTVDLPTTNNTTISTFADDTALLAAVVTSQFQRHLTYSSSGTVNGKSK
jgi:hypothetical protein